MNDLISRQLTQKNDSNVLDTLDCVRRKDAINEIARWKGYLDEDMIARIQIGLKKLPSAQRTGRWIDGKVKHIKNGELRNVRECSECGSSYFVYDYYNSVDETPKFCPNCGARMEVE